MDVVTRVIDHKGCRLAYDVRGSGPRVLFIQGVGVHADGWLPQINSLAARYTCLSFDNRGMGRSQPIGAALTVEQLADDARAIMDAQRWTSAHIVGHSLGGLIAIAFALASTSRIKSLSLLCTFADGRSAAPLTLRMLWAGCRARIGTRRMRRHGFLRLVMPTQAVAEGDADQLADDLAPLFGHDLADQPAVVPAQLRAMRGADTTRRLEELASTPTLIVSGAHDPIAPPSLGRELAAGIPGSRYVEYADASHGLPIQWSERVNALLEEHLASADARNALGLTGSDGFNVP
jgi:pimeloyl-ACP methyl ester carboxylesterase